MRFSNNNILTVIFSSVVFLLSCNERDHSIEYVEIDHVQESLEASKQIHFENFTIEDGLPENSVMQFLEDSRGNQWFTTQDGIVRISNNKFISYSYSEVNDHSILQNFNWLKLIDDTVLVSFSKSGVARYDYKSDQFERILELPDNEVVLGRHKGDLRAVDYDKYGFWFQSASDSLIHVVNEKGESKFKVKGQLYKKRNLEDRLLFCTVNNSGSWLYEVKINSEQEIAVYVVDSCENLINLEVKDADSYYYLKGNQIFDSKEGLVDSINIDYVSSDLLYDQESKVFFVVYTNDHITKAILYKENNKISETNEIKGGYQTGTLRTDEGFIIVRDIVNDEAKDRVLRVDDTGVHELLDDLKTEKFTYNGFYNFLEITDQGVVYIGTWGDGLYYSNLASFSNYKIEIDNTDNKYVPFYFEGDQVLIVSSDAEFYAFNIETGDKSLIYKVNSPSYTVCYKRHGDKIYFTAGQAGYVIYDIGLKEFELVSINTEQEQISATGILVDENERVWICSSGRWSTSSLLCIENNSWRFFKSNNSDTSYNDPRVMDVFEYDHNIYVTDQSGLYRYIEESSHFIKQLDGLYDPAMRLAYARDSAVWVSTFVHGLLKLDLSNNKVINKYSNSNNNFPINWVDIFTFIDSNTVLFKGERQQWYTFKINTEEVSLINNYEENFYYYHFTPVLYKDTKYFLPGIGGFVLVDLEHKNVPSLNNLKISSIYVGENKMEIDDTKKISQLNFSHKETSIKMTFEFIHFYDDEFNFYYRVQGYSNEWVKLDITESLYLNNLPYNSDLIFEVKAMDLNGVESEFVHRFNIHIDKPWWQYTWFYIVVVVVLIVIIYLIILWRTSQLRQRQLILEGKIKEATEELVAQKQEIEHAHEELGEKHKEITDSINYAERIQRSFLATQQMLDANLKDYFVMFQPKEAVSGDFYWAHQFEDGSFTYITADSTGHGVPGAIMSILNISSLEKSVETHEQCDQILGTTRQIIIDRLKKDGSPEGGKDGMDCSLVKFNADKTRMTLASAHNAVWVVREGELIEFKGDKIPVGKHDRDNESFTLQTFDLQKGDVIYTTTDGFPDQFGGDKGKKFMVKKMKELLIGLAPKPMAEQKTVLEQTFNDWKLNQEQIDDVCVIGVRI